MKAVKTRIEYFVAIHHADKILRESREAYQTAPTKEQAIENAKSFTKALVEEAVIASGQIATYNRIFAVLRHKNGDLWMVVEYRPTFQYIIHNGYQNIQNFARTLGVRIA